MTQAAEAPRNMAGGYTKSYRRKWDNKIFRDFREVAIWAWMCDTAQAAAYRMPTKYGTVELGRGELIIAEREISDKFFISRHAVRQLLDRMENDEMIVRDVNRKPHESDRKISRLGTVVRILKYDIYQCLDEQVADNENRQPQPQTNRKLPKNNSTTYKKEEREPDGSLSRAGGADDGGAGRKPDPAAERQWLGTDDALPGQMPLPGVAELPVATPAPAAAEPVAAREPVTVPEPLEQLEQPAPEILPPEPVPPDPTVMQAPAPRAEPAREVAALAGEVVSLPSRCKPTGNRLFDEFYAAYPLKKSPKDALRAYVRAIRQGANHAELMAGLERYKREVIDRDPRHIKHPATWLNGGCWNDEPTPAQALPNGYHHDQHHAYRRQSAGAVRGAAATLELAERWLGQGD